MVDWELDVALPAAPPTHIESDYRSWFCPDAEGTPGNDLALQLHPNGLCVVALAPGHAALHVAAAAAGGAAGAGTQPAAPYQAGTEAEQQQHGQQPADQQQAQEQAAAAAGPAQLSLSAKLQQAEFRKGRGPVLHPDTVIGRLYAGGASYTLRCCVRGLLVEVNSRLQDLSGDALLRELGRSYLAILEPRAVDVQALAGRCLSQQQYQERRQARQSEQQAGQEPRPAAQHAARQQAEQQPQGGAVGSCAS